MPITQAQLTIGDINLRQRVSAADHEVVFETALEAGEKPLQSWFLDDAGDLLAGAYYVEVERVLETNYETTAAALCPPSDSSCFSKK